LLTSICCMVRIVNVNMLYGLNC